MRPTHFENNELDFINIDMDFHAADSSFTVFIHKLNTAELTKII